MKGFFDKEPPDWAVDSFNPGQYTKCGHCGAWETAVRPGKTQCDNPKCGDGFADTMKQA